MTTFLAVWLVILSLAAPLSAAPRISCHGSKAVATGRGYEARFDGPSLVYFKNTLAGETLIEGDRVPLPYVRFIEGSGQVTLRPGRASDFTAKPLGKDRVRFTGTLRSGDIAADVAITVKALDDELQVWGRARGRGTFEGVASIGIAFGPSSPGAIILAAPAQGQRFGATGFRAPQRLEWPLSWEAAMALVQGRRGGLLACAFEPFRRFKNLELTPEDTGWSATLESENDAPFQGHRSVRSLVWRFRPYRGDWRQGTAIYRGWLWETFRPDTGEDPAWVREIRAEVHCGLDPKLPAALAEAGLDPEQTLLYVANWRTNGYDRNYPDYAPNEKLVPFMENAHRLGFRVMLHVNYFGCDPKMPEYQRLRQYQMRHKYSGVRLWWQWTRADPPIKFAYINPASREWRRLFVSKMVELVNRTGADALHLDQTLCIFNDRNGRIDGLSSAEGNLLLHEELKAALPQVALSGEGLNEVTMIHEAFAQRHVRGIYHADARFHRGELRRTHPLAGYLFGSRTKSYPYLGCRSPAEEQFFVAWTDAYRYGGVLPGDAWPSPASLRDPSPVHRQALDVIRAFQRHRLDPDVEGPWPAAVDYPYRSASGEPFAYSSDASGWTLSRTDRDFKPVEEFSRTIAGVRFAELPGTIPGWLCYDGDRLAGLDPEAYYVYWPERRDLGAFHLETQSETIRMAGFGATEDLAWLRLDRGAPLIDTQTLISSARSHLLSGDGTESPLTGEVSERTGAVVQPRGAGLFMHPPWKIDPGGVTGIRFSAGLPREAKAAFRADCALESGAAGNSDGVVFTVTARAAGGGEISAQSAAASASPVPLYLDVSRFAGHEVSFEVTVSPGPERDPSYDWALLQNPRVTTAASHRHACRIVWPPGMRHLVAPEFRPLAGDGPPVTALDIPDGGAAFAVGFEPAEVAGVVDLTAIERRDQVVTYSGVAGGLKGRKAAHIGPETIDGVTRQGIFAHPPDHGLRLVHYFLSAPAGSKITFTADVGLREGSRSQGVRFAVWRNGEDVWSQSLLPGDGWQEVEFALEDRSQDPFVLTLVTDSEGSYHCDWAVWGEPKLTVEP